MCACHSWHSTPAKSVILCSLGRIGHLNYSQSCGNALIYTVVLQLHIVCVNPLVLG